MSETNIKMQIEEDIQEYQAKFPHIPNIDKPEWAFNFWVLDKLYSQDEEIIPDRIIDYNDKGVDCFVWHEEQLDLYLIQNKYFNEKSRLTLDYINDFLTRALTALKNGTYSHSPELQGIYTKFSGKSGFAVKLILYVTNDSCKTKTIENAIKKFNQGHEHESAAIYGLTDIGNLYYREPHVDTKSMIFQLQTPNNRTTLSVNNEAYKLNQAIDAMYIMTPVYSLYTLYKQAEEEKYNIFDANIREYLGAKGAVNKKIKETLKNPEERKHFFYYNNGVTIIVKSMTTIPACENFSKIEIEDPQIINGCQTVSTINEVLSGLPDESLEQEFQDTFVMLKILVIPDESEEMRALRDNIVRFNNSQNAIDQKTFEANAKEFKRLQKEFRNRGLLICIKQSDKYQYTNKEFKNASPLIKLNAEIMAKYSLTHLKETKYFTVDLSKLLQVILAFVSTPQNATQRKASILVPDSELNKIVLKFIKRNDVTINALVSLWMLYIRAENEKSNSEKGTKKAKGKFPPLYLIHCLSRYECEGDPAKIEPVLSDEDKINRLIQLYKVVCQTYFDSWRKKNDGLAYNDMIKAPIDYALMDQLRQLALNMAEND